jgi:hypothetical protein
MKVALVEISGSHDECLYTQVRIINSRPNTALTLFVTPALIAQVSGIVEPTQLRAVSMRKGWRGLIDAIALRNLLVREGFDLIVFNTCQGKAVRNTLMLPYPTKTRFAGVLHHTDKLVNSFTQKAISRKVKHYFVLSDRLLPADRHSDLRFSYFYPIEFPAIRGRLLPKHEGEVWLCVPGQVEEKRRDYEALISAIRTKGLAPHIRLVLLGRYGNSDEGKRIHARIEALGLGAQVMMWQDFVPNELFHSLMHQCDAVLPLLHPSTASFKLYDNRITGAFNLAIGYGKTLILERSFENYPDFAGRSVFYRTDKLPELLNTLTMAQLPPAPPDGKFAFKSQCARYWDFITGE